MNTYVLHHRYYEHKPVLVILTDSDTVVNLLYPLDDQFCLWSFPRPDWMDKPDHLSQLLDECCEGLHSDLGGSCMGTWFECLENLKDQL